MKATIVYVAPSKEERAIIEVTKKFGPATVKVASGWTNVDKGTKKGDSFDLPDSTKISTETRGDFVELLMQ